MTTLRQMVAKGSSVFAPLVLNPMMAEKAGARAIDLGGGASGYQGAFTEANLSLTEMAHAGLEIGSAGRRGAQRPRPRTIAKWRTLSNLAPDSIPALQRRSQGSMGWTDILRTGCAPCV